MVGGVFLLIQVWGNDRNMIFWIVDSRVERGGGLAENIYPSSDIVGPVDIQHL